MPKREGAIKEEPPARYPIGTGGEISESRREIALPVENVDNVVYWVNPAFPPGTLPFDIKKKESTNLAVFFSLEEEGRRKLPIMPESSKGRSGLLGEVIFRDKDGNLYRDIDAKGIGHLRKDYLSEKLEYEVAPLVVEQEDSPWQVKGLVNSKYAHADRYSSERLLEAGIRTYRVVAIVELKELVIVERKETAEGEKTVSQRKVSVKEAWKAGLIPINFVPVVEIRAYQGTRERIDILAGRNAPRERREAAYEDAKALAAQEMGKDPDELSGHEYLTWFAKTLGKQIAKLHKLGLHHGYLTSHNITLDCQIIDLDSVAEVEQKISKSGVYGTAEGYFKSDLSSAKWSLESMVDGVRDVLSRIEGASGQERHTATLGDYHKLLDESYEQEFESQTDQTD